MPSLRRMRGIQMKILGVVLLGVVAVVGVSALSLQGLRDAMLTDRQRSLEAATGVLHSQIATIKARLDQGTISEEVARGELIGLIHAARYNGGAYFGVYDKTGIMIAHGTTRAFDGADMLHHENPAVRSSTKAMLDLCAGGGNGFLTLLGSKAGHPEINVEKLYYAASFTPWGLVTVTSSELDDIAEAFRAEAWRTGFAGLAVALVLAAAGLIIGRGVSSAVGRLDVKMRELAEGRLDIELEESARRDEIGHMARSVQFFRDRLREAERMRSAQEADKRQAEEDKHRALAGLADRFEELAHRLIASVADRGVDMQEKAEAMRKVSDQSMRLTAEVSEATEQTSANVDTVAAASEELAASIGEIGRQVATSARVAGEAVDLAGLTNQKVAGLEQAAERIGAVIDLINSIASQTNLLALNATIEAARAGEAGKGFAVVASEVKILATQTAHATEEISSQIGAIQTVTREAAQEISKVSQVINQISEIAAAISSAVEEQAAATREISDNVQRAAAGAQTVAGTISEVKAAVGDSGRMAVTVLSGTHDLADRIGTLGREVETFLLSIREA